MIVGYVLGALGLAPIVVSLTHIIDPILVFFMNIFGIAY